MAELVYDIAIDRADIDHMGHVNNAIYLKWAQAIAERHWQAFAPPEMFESRFWVAVEHSIKYRKPAFIGDAIRGTLVVESLRGARALFELRIYRAHDLLATVKSWWCSVDRQSHKPKLLTAEIIDLFQAPCAS
jgi:acyl-CoA thioester hydrolase